MTDAMDKKHPLSLDEKRAMAAQLLREKRPGVASFYPLSVGQQALWVGHQLAPQSGVYNVSFAARVRGQLDVIRLRRSFQTLVDRHPALRTTFEAHAEQHFQRVQERQEVCFKELDSAAWDWNRLSHYLAEEMYNPFDLRKGPLFRVSLVKRSERDYALLMTAHHIIGDFWSLVILLDELCVLYAGEREPEEAALKPLNSRYEDFVQWQSKMLNSSEGERLWAFWRQRLDGELPRLDLPIAHPRPQVRTYRGAAHRFRLNESLTLRLRSFGKIEGVTLYVILLSAFQTLLHRYTGQDEILVGSPSAGRNRSTFVDIVGYFANLFVVRSSFLGGPSVKTLLGQVRESVLSALDHQDFPFPLLVERLGVTRDPSRPPVFQVMFTLEQSPAPSRQGASLFIMGHPGARLALGGVAVESLDLKLQTAEFDLTLMMEEFNGSLFGIWQYNADLFAPTAVARMAGHYHQFLEAFVGQPDEQVTYLSLLTEVEQSQLLVEWNDTTTDLLPVHYFNDSFELQVRRKPDSIAVVFEDESLSYWELNGLANQLAHNLRRLGVGPEVRVGICLGRSLEMVLALLAVVKAGGAYVPLDPSLPQERLAWQIKDSQLSLTLTHRQAAERLPAHGADEVWLNCDELRLARFSEEAPHTQLWDQNLAYVIYTSGSTGRPKGVEIGQRALSNFLWSMRQRPGLTDHDVLFAVTTLSFDIAALELFLPLMVGARLVVVGRDVASNGEALIRRLSETAATVMQATPATWRLLIESGWEGAPRLSVFCGGEAWSRDLARELLKRGRSLWNLYGPTETTVWSGAAAIGSEERGPVLLGRPIADTQLYVLDPQHQMTPVGVWGQVCIGGVGVARGYNNRTDLTADRFRPDPYSSVRGARLYQSGDLARYGEDGRLEMQGRLDYQVKVRGHRVELLEVEAALSQHRSVRQAAVMAQADGSGEQRLVAYLVVEAALSYDELLEFLRHNLPEYMLPSAFVTLKSLPLTANGKVDRLSLPAASAVRQWRKEEFIEPRNQVERELAEIWAKLLGIQRVGIEDNFFELGGHSLLATRVISRLRKTLQVELPVRSLFEAPTIAKLAPLVIAAGRLNQTPPCLPLEPVARGHSSPLSFSQQRLWFLEQLNPGGPLYNISGIIQLKGRLNVEALGQSLQEIVRRHESLRTVFEAHDGLAIAVVRPAVRLPFPTADLSRLPGQARERQLLRLANEHARLGFNLASGPLLRVELLRLTETDHACAITIHHLISDGWSIGALIQELGTLYESFIEGRTSPLKELTVQYADFAHWQRRWFEEDLLKSQLAYWREYLGAAPGVLPLPTDRLAPAIQSYTGAIESFAIPAHLSEAIKALSSQEGVTLFMASLAVFQSLLYKYTGEDDIIIGTPIAGRRHAEIEGLIGCFVNTLVLRANFAKNPTFKQLLAQVREDSLEAYAHQDLPFEQLVEALRPERDLSGTPVAQVMFILQNAPIPAITFPGMRLSAHEVHTGTAKFSLTLAIAEADQGLKGSVEYKTDLFNVTTIRRLGEHYRHLLEEIIMAPGARMSRLALLTEVEQAQLLVEWNDTARDLLLDESFPQAFERRVSSCPDVIAVVFEDEHLSYRELNRRSNQLAHHLWGLGVTPEARVGICMKRSLEMVVGLLGILKAGGAYVPLDPSYPRERLAWQVMDARLAGIVTEHGVGEGLLDNGIHEVKLDLDWASIGRQDEENPWPQLRGSNLAYVIFTSGSTGKPKGVEIEHRALSNFLRSMEREPGLSGRDVMIAVTTLSFDIAGYELMLPLLVGARVVVVSREAAGDGTRLMRILRESEPTVMQGTPATWRMLVEAGWEGGEGMKILCGGEAWGWDLAKALQERGESLWNMYGPTETTIWSAVKAVGYEEEGVMLVGGPIAGTQLYILDRDGMEAPVGIWGQLWIGGVGLSRGYSNRGELTGERFKPDPYSKVGGERLYQTGDLARYRWDGRIELLGRIDHQVKIRGYRIELGEVEEALSQHPDVMRTVVTAQRDGNGEKRLVAYIVRAEGAALERRELREYMRERLPDYMAPPAYVFVTALPLTPNGKVDRLALSALDQASTDLEGAHVAPRNQVERELAAIWSTLLGVEKIGVYDNFFELGGHSLLVTQMLSRLRETFQVELTAPQIFEAPSICGISISIARRQAMQIDEKTLAKVIAEIRQLSTQEIETMLSVGMDN